MYTSHEFAMRRLLGYTQVVNDGTTYPVYMYVLYLSAE